MVTKNTIEQSNAFKALDPATGRAFLHKSNYNQIQHELTVLKTVGIENWKSGHLRPLMFNIIIELYGSN